MSRKLSNLELETIITFNREEKTACIFTYEKTWQKHLEDKLGLKPLYDNGFGGKEYEINKKRIKMPRAPMRLLPETKIKRVKVLAEARAKRILPSKTLVAINNPAKKTPNKG